MYKGDECISLIYSNANEEINANKINGIAEIRVRIPVYMTFFKLSLSLHFY